MWASNAKKVVLWVLGHFDLALVGLYLIEIPLNLVFGVLSHILMKNCLAKTLIVVFRNSNTGIIVKL